MTTATPAGRPVHEHTDEATRRTTRTGIVLMVMMPVTIAAIIVLMWLWLTVPLR